MFSTNKWDGIIKPYSEREMDIETLFYRMMTYSILEGDVSLIVNWPYTHKGDPYENMYKAGDITNSGDFEGNALKPFIVADSFRMNHLVNSDIFKNVYMEENKPDMIEYAHIYYTRSSVQEFRFFKGYHIVDNKIIKKEEE